MKLPKVIHVELREPYNGKRHFYFGSIAAIFDELSEEQIGIKCTAPQKLDTKLLGCFL